MAQAISTIPTDGYRDFISFLHSSRDRGAMVKTCEVVARFVNGQKEEHLTSSLDFSKTFLNLPSDDRALYEFMRSAWENTSKKSIRPTSIEELVSSCLKLPPESIHRQNSERMIREYASTRPDLDISAFDSVLDVCDRGCVKSVVDAEIEFLGIALGLPLELPVTKNCLSNFREGFEEDIPGAWIKFEKECQLYAHRLVTASVPMEYHAVVTYAEDRTRLDTLITEKYHCVFQPHQAIA